MPRRAVDDVWTTPRRPSSDPGGQDGHIEDLSRWVLDTACRQVSAWCAEPWARDDLHLGVNLSAA